MQKDSIINCHTHIFTADHVPPLLAKTFVPTPFHWLIPLRPIVALFKWWYRGPNNFKYSVRKKKLERLWTNIQAFINRLFPFNIIAGYYIFFFAFFLLYSLVTPVFPPDESWISKIIFKLSNLLSPAFPVIPYIWLKVLIVVFVILYFTTIRNIIFAIAGLLWKALGKLPGKQSKEMAKRYLNIGRYAFHQEQETILSKLKGQYPKGTGFVVLPMDMDYMDAHSSKSRYRDQMKSLAAVKAMPSNKDILYPFIFADPRRMVNAKDELDHRAGDKDYFTWTSQNGKVTLGDCFMKDYIEGYGFSGIKIYPALGYYPFDEKLLPLWKYAADNNIPIMTHCIRGTIFYRGRKKDEWNRHPVFKQAMEKKKDHQDTDGYKDDEELEKEHAGVTQYEPLVLSQFKNVDFSINFTHPMNLLCLLEEELLRQLITAAIEKDPTTQLIDLFGYKGPDEPMTYSLKNLKICLGHFGGDDEWLRYFEKDRYNYSSQLTKHPSVGIKFFETVHKKPSKGKLEQLWKYTDWYSIICSMMLQYPQVYADISYILHSDKDIFPLLKQSLQNPGLKEKILYGSDFFVVRNHKSDKNMLADMTGGMSETDFDQIARVNPRKFLANTLQP